MHSTIADKSWYPDRPISKGATAYHNAVIDTSWHKENIDELIELVKNKINSDDLVVDFGAGTGSSAVYLLENIKKQFDLLLVDNSPSWLGKAYELLSKNKNVIFLLLEKHNGTYQTLDQLVGVNSMNHVISGNTVHLIPNIEETFEGIYKALKKGGSFTFQSGNIAFSERNEDIMMIDDSVNKIHDIAIGIIRSDSTFDKYKNDLDLRIEQQKEQRKFVFPHPRPIAYYLKILQSVGFKDVKVTYKQIKVLYDDWLNFVRVRRLQAGILPEVGGINASPQEEHDRDVLITKAATLLFTDLEMNNALSNRESFTAEWTYVQGSK